MNERIAAVIVTYNRSALLRRCLTALEAQGRRPDMILIVDNASSDTTIRDLRESGWLDRSGVSLLALSANTGGAGGFAAGMAHAASLGFDWIWLMDDDAEPHAEALARLWSAGLQQDDVYGSVAVSGTRLSWPMTPRSSGGGKRLYRTAELPSIVDVQFIPFLGLLVSRTLVERIGTPDAGFFIAADDVDYCLRARAVGARILLVGDSRIEHPASDYYSLRFPWGRFFALRLVPWKRYYDVRNRLFVARRHYGWRLYWQTIPGSFLRLLATLLHEGQRTAQLRAFAAGMIDGLLGRSGRRHEVWGIRP